MLMMAMSLTTTGRPLRTPESVPDGTPHFSVMTYNVLASNVSEKTVKAILDADADVVCLQETTHRWDAKLAARLQARYPHRVMGGPDDRADGVTVFSRFPLRNVQSIKPQDQGWFHSMLFIVDSPCGPVQILNVHLRPLINYHSQVIGYFTVDSIHLREMQALENFLAPGLPTLIVGDFNEGNSGKATAWLTSARHFTDALPEFDFESPTWHGPVAGIPFTYRLDHIMYSANLQCFDARAIKTGDSDHYPVVAVIGIAR